MEIEANIIVQRAMQEEMFAVLISYATLTSRTCSIKFMPKIVLIQCIKLQTEFCYNFNAFNIIELKYTA